MFGQMVERQASEQRARGEPIAIERGPAAAATAGALALEVGGAAGTLGKSLVKKVLGIADDPALLARASQEQLVAAANRSLAAATGRGVARGAAIEMPVEVAQSVLERAQAGLPVTGDDAFSEYGEAAYLAGVTGGALGGAGGVSSRGAARRGLEAQEARAEELRQAAEVGPPLPGPEQAGPILPPRQAELFEAPPRVEEVPTATERGERYGPEMSRLRDEFDRLQRENQRLRTQYDQETDPAKKEAIRAEAANLAPQLKQLAAEYSRLRAITPEEAPGARRPQAPEEQLELPFDNTIRLQDLVELGIPMEGGSPAVVGVRGWMRDNVLGKTPEQVQRMVDKKPDLLQGQGLRARVLRDLISPKPVAYEEPAREPVTEPRSAPAAPEQRELDFGGAEPSVGVPVSVGTESERGAQPTTAPTEAELSGLARPEVDVGVGARSEEVRAPALEERTQRGALGARVAAEEWEEFKPEGAPTFDQLPLRAQSEWAKRATRPTGAVTLQDADEVFDIAIQDVGYLANSFNETRPKDAPADQMFADTTEGRVAKAFYDALPEQNKKRVEQERDRLAEQKRSGSAARTRFDEEKKRKTEEEKEYADAERERQREEAKRKKAEEKEPPKPRKERRKAKFRVADKEVKGNPQPAVQQLVDKITKRWKNAPNIVVVQSVSDLPPDISKEVEDAKVNPKGAFSGDTVFVIADNATGYNDVLLTVAHEAIGHYGLRAVLGNKFNTTLENLYNTNDQVKAKADQKITAGLPKLTAIEETLADAVEERIPPSSTMGRALQTIKNIIRAFFRKLGVKTLNDSEVQMLLDASRDYVIEGKQPEVATEPAATPEETAIRFRSVTAIVQGFSPQPGGTARQMADSARDGVLKFRTTFADKAATVFNDLSKAFNNNAAKALELKEVEAVYRQAEASDQMLEAFYRKGFIERDPNTKLWKVVEKQGKAPPSKLIELAQTYAKDNNLKFDEAWDQLSQILQAAREHTFREHNANRQAGVQALPRNMPDPEVDRLYQIYQSDATIKEIVKVMDTVRFDMIDNMAEVGRISKDTADAWKEASNYVPLDRLIDLDVKLRTPQKRFGRGIAQLGKLPELVDAEWVKQPPKNVLENYYNTMGWMLQQTVKQDATLRTLRALEDAGQAKFFKYRPTDRNVSDRLVQTFYKGEEVYFLVDTPYQAVAFNVQMAPTLGFVGLMSQFSRALRTAITAVPTFTAAQLPQDIQRAIMYSGVKDPLALSAKVLGNFAVFSKAAMQGKLAEVAPELSKFGVAGGVDFHISNPAESFLQDMGVRQRTLLKSSTAGKLLNRLQAVAVASDLAMRQAIYDQTMKESQGDELLATQRAREIINFRRYGAGDRLGLLHWSTQTVPFYNAMIQGMDVLYRSLTGKEAPSGMERNAALKMFWNKAAFALGASMVYSMAMADDEEYENMDLRERDRTWVIGGGIGIPVPSEIGILLKALPERVLEYYRKVGTPDERVAMEAVIAYFKTDLRNEYLGRVVPIPVAIRPIAEVMTNYSFLTGREIEGIFQKQQLPSERTTSRTSEFAKSVAQFMAAGPGIEVSPIAIDTVLQGYLGTTAALGLAVADQMINPNKTDRPLHQIVGMAPFAYDPVGTRRTTEFYDLREKVVQSQNSLNQMLKTDPDRAAAFAEKNASLLASYKMINSTLQELEKSREYKRYLDTEMAAQAMSSEERLKMKQDVQAYEQRLVEWVRLAKNELKI
jgi:hypothetical protein